MLTRAPSGIRSTSGKPGPGPALNPTDVVTMPGAASAAVGASSKAATKTLLSFMTGSSSCEQERSNGTSVPRDAVEVAERLKCGAGGFNIHPPFIARSVDALEARAGARLYIPHSEEPNMRP